MLAAVFFLVAFLAALGDPRGSVLSALVTGYAFGCLPFGWRSLPRVSLSFFLLVPLLGRVMYFFAKLMLGLVIGLFIGPIKIHQAVRSLKA